MRGEYLPKEKAVYQAVLELFEEGSDLNTLTVAEITARAGIGKGTAYEYFSGKEEMIAKAFLYNGEELCKQLYEGMHRRETLYERVNFILLEMEHHAPKAECIFRLIHMLADNSTVSKWIKELLKQRELSGKILAADIIRMMLEDELKDENALSEEEMTYLVLSIYSKFFCYGMLLKEDRYRQAQNRDAIRELINRGICKEVEELTG